MKPLYAKEIRLLRPAYLMALLLAVVPVWLFSALFGHDSPEGAALMIFLFGAVMLALSAFGREFGLQTFALILAQPLERRRIWRTKCGLLAGAMLTVFGAWWISCFACAGRNAKELDPDALLIGGVGTVMAFAGGLWTTLLLRQVAAAFWFTILLPALIAVTLSQAPHWQMLGVLGLYAAAGFWWARHQFLGAQETAWTGGVIAFPGRRGTQTTLGARKYRPWAALFWKELQLHQVGLMGMAWLFLMHLVVLWLRRMDYSGAGVTVRTLLEVFGGAWLVVPWLVSAVSVAEERKLGTLAQHLSLPMSRRAQFGMKLGLTLLIGGLLSALLMCTLESVGDALHAGRGTFGHGLSPSDAAWLCLYFVGFALVGFYASTLARNVVQTLAVAAAGTIAIVVLGAVAPQPGQVLRLWLWQGYLVYYIGWPALVITLLWLAWRNFRSEAGSDHLWARNALVLGTVLAGVVLLTFGIYNRLWELLTPVDPRPGPARITGTKPVILNSSGGSALTALLPDGRLWVDRIEYKPRNCLLAFGERSGFWIGGQWNSLRGNQIAPGSNWVSAVADRRETAAIRADGTLWISEKPRPEEAARLIQFGTETNWQHVVREYYTRSVVLLKQDGTLWRLGTLSFSEKNEWPGLRSFTPQRLLPESGWNRILVGTGAIYAWKDDGSAWALHPPERHQADRQNSMGVVLDRVPQLDNSTWHSLARFMGYQVALRADETLWAWPIERKRPSKAGEATIRLAITRISPDTNWAQVAGEYDSLALRKTDGSVWRWTLASWYDRETWFRSPPTRLGSRHDWLAVASAFGGVMTLAADGNLYYWWDPTTPPFSRGDSDQPMLAPSRKPSLVGNILAQ